MDPRRNVFFSCVLGFAYISSWFCFLLSGFYFFGSFLGYFQEITAFNQSFILPLSISFACLLASVAFLNIIYRPKIIVYQFLGVVLIFYAGLNLYNVFYLDDTSFSVFGSRSQYSMHFIEALSYFLLGFVFAFWFENLKRFKFSGLIKAFCMVVFFLSLEGIAIYALPIKLKELSLIFPFNFLSSIVLTIVSLGILSWAFYQDWFRGIRVAKWVPYIVSGVVLVFNLFFISGLYQQRKIYLSDVVKSKGDAVFWNVDRSLNLIVNLLDSWVKKLDKELSIEKIDFETESKLIFSVDPAIVNIGILNENLSVLGQVTSENTPFYFPSDKELKKGFSSTFAAINPVNHHLFLYAQVQGLNQSNKIAFYDVDISKLFIEFETKLGFEDYDIELNLGGFNVYKTEKLSGNLSRDFIYNKTFDFLNLKFSLEMIPSKNLLGSNWISILIDVCIIFGFFGTVVSGFCIYLIQLIVQRNSSLLYKKIQADTLSEILAEVNKQEDILHASQKILDILYKHFGWQVIVYWQKHISKEYLELRHFSKVPGIECQNFEEACKTAAPPSELLVDHSFKNEHLFWYSDFGSENLERSQAAKKDGLRGCFGILFYNGNVLVGALELFQKELFHPDLEMHSLESMSNIANQFSIFIERREFEILSKQLNAIFSSSFDAIYLLDTDLKIIQWNLSAEKLFGWTFKEVQGQSTAILIPDSGGFELDNLKKISKSEVFGKHYDTQRLTKDGKLIWVNLIHSPVLDQNNRVTSISVIAEDISDRILIEKTKNEFISMVSHELRSPLTSIVGALGILKDTKQFQGENLDLLQLAERNANRLTNIISDILDIEKINLGKFKIELKPIFLANAIEDAISQCSSFALEQGIQIISKDLFKDIQVEGDFNRIVQVLSNLLSNAIKFSSKGSSVIVSMNIIDTKVRVSVTDFGIGISKEYQSRIFEKFVQASSGNTKIKGTGLGLNICRGLLKEMGAIIDFISTEGKGSTFFFEFFIWNKEINKS